MQRNHILILLSIFCLFGWGCRQNSLEDKHASLLPVKDLTIAGLSSKVYIGERIGFLLSGLNAGETEMHEGRLNAVFAEEGAIGLAGAVSEDGYFLTAYHVVEEADKVHLVSSQDMDTLLEATVIWRSQEHDLALIRGPVETIPFPIAPPAIAGLACFCGGGLSGSCSAGKIDKVSSKAGFSTIIHTAPLMAGDSGGPLITHDGLLLGINVQDQAVVTLNPLLFKAKTHRRSKASMIDAELLEKIIGQDRAKIEWLKNKPAAPRKLVVRRS
jgi:S1-C subfamily serine protease